MEEGRTGRETDPAEVAGWGLPWQGEGVRWRGGRKPGEGEKGKGTHIKDHLYNPGEPGRFERQGELVGRRGCGRGPREW